jgi:hypothetical protein
MASTAPAWGKYTTISNDDKNKEGQEDYEDNDLVSLGVHGIASICMTEYGGP